MGFYNRYILPHVINCACGTKPIMKERAKVTPRARGVVLELGFGSGRNLGLYDPAKVTRLFALEPEPGIRALGEKAAEGLPFPVEVLPDKAEDLRLPPASVDTILLTYTLCTIPDGVTALRKAREALKPDGQLLFCEHGLSTDAKVARTQAAIEPMWKRIAGGCRLTHNIPKLIEAGGFVITELTAWNLPKTPAFAGFTYRGAARPA
jgi:SAM-dependent methyltransferase